MPRSRPPLRRILISGWEYNRLLVADPFVPLNSALPSSFLWNGGAEYWLFETAECTREAFDNELRAGREANWATADVYEDLRTMGALSPIDLSKDLSHTGKEEYAAAHARLRNSEGSPTTVMSLMESSRIAELERLKYELMWPVARDREAILSGAPHPLFSTSADSADTEQMKRVKQFLEDISAPIAGASFSGLKLARPFGTSLTERERSAWLKAQEAERLVLPATLAGDADGTEACYRIIREHKTAYASVQQHLSADWAESKIVLDRLRAAASKYLWPDLHGDWLPRVASGDWDFLENEFPSQMRRALAIRPIAELLNLNAAAVFAFTTGTALALAQVAGASPDALEVVGATMPAAATLLVGAKSKFNEPLSLGLFYQKGRRQVRRLDRSSRRRDVR